jgi:hypothetical protein
MVSTRPDNSPSNGTHKEDQMKKDLKRIKKLHLTRETLSFLTHKEVTQVEGGNTLTCYFSCAYACQTIGNGAGREEQFCTF